MKQVIERVLRESLLGLSVTGEPCEACGKHMHNHEWADMDDWGFVIHCSNLEL